MVRETICLYDSDVLYARMVIKALQEESLFPGVFVCFSEWDALCKYLEDNQISLLLLEKSKKEAFYEQLTKAKLSGGSILLLSEESECMEDEIYKYLPKKQFVAKLRGWWSVRHGERDSRVESNNGRKGSRQVITGYITFGGVALTRYLSGIQHRNEKSLVMDLQLFAYTLPHEKPKKNLSDLIYMATINRLAKAEMKDFIYSVQGLDCVEPVAHYSDGYELDDEAAELLFHYLRTLPYERIYIVTDCRHRGAARLLELCDEVEVETADNAIERHKNSLMIKMLHLEGREELLCKIEQPKREMLYG